MNCLDPSAGISPIVSRSAGREALANALKLYVGNRGTKRRLTMQQLVEGAGVKARVIECIMEDAESEEYRKIEIGDLLSISAFLGQVFITEWLRPSGYGAFELNGQAPLPGVLATADATETPEDERKRLIRRLAELEGL